MQNHSFRTGCRYWPRAKGPFFLAGGLMSWEARWWDVGEVREELSHLAEMGFDFVRVGVPWEGVQPDVRRLRSVVLDRLVMVLDAAQAVGLTVQLTVMGQLGGTLFVPRWLLASDPQMARTYATQRVISEDWLSPLPLGNVYRETRLVAGQRWLWGELSRHLGAHPALTEMDVGMGGLLSGVTSRHADEAFLWWEGVTSEVDEGGVGLLYSDRMALLQVPNVPRLHEWQAMVKRLALATSTRAGEKMGHVDQQWPLFQMHVAQTLATVPLGCAAIGLPTSDKGWIEETLESETPNAPPRLITRYAEEEQARFFDAVLPALYHLGSSFICHVTWADVPKSLYLTPPYDQNVALRYGGLLRADGREKEAVQIWRSFHERRSTLGEPNNRRFLNRDRDEWYARRHETEFVETLYRQYRYGEI